MPDYDAAIKEIRELADWDEKQREDEMPETHRRIGTFRVSQSLLRDAHWEGLQALFRGLVILDATADFATNTVRYWALSEQFEFVLPSVMPPHYVATCTLVDGEYVCEWAKGEDEIERRTIFQSNSRIVE
jgi:hypothetical protein